MADDSASVLDKLAVADFSPERLVRVLCSRFLRRDSRGRRLGYTNYSDCIAVARRYVFKGNIVKTARALQKEFERQVAVATKRDSRRAPIDPLAARVSQKEKDIAAYGKWAPNISADGFYQRYFGGLAKGPTPQKLRLLCGFRVAFVIGGTSYYLSTWGPACDHVVICCSLGLLVVAMSTIVPPGTPVIAELPDYPFKGSVHEADTLCYSLPMAIEATVAWLKRMGADPDSKVICTEFPPPVRGLDTERHP